MLQRAFIDLLFILLCSAIVLLSESVRLGTVEAKPAEVGGGAVTPISVDQVRLIVVRESELVFEDRPYQKLEALLRGWHGDECAVLIPSDETIAHHRMMSVWSDFKEIGLQVKFGAKPRKPNVELSKTVASMDGSSSQ